jgi:hypothetical protein
MDPDQMVTLSLEGAFSILILTIAYKIYRSKIKTHSGCCLKENNGNGFSLDSQNSGVTSEEDVLNKL